MAKPAARRHARHLCAALLGSYLSFLVAACEHRSQVAPDPPRSASRAVVTSSDSRSVAASSSPFSPSSSLAVSALPDPGRVGGTGETSVANEGASGSAAVSLRQLSGAARTLIIRWTCDGNGVLSLALDGVQRASGPCAGASDVVSAAIPLSASHPRVLRLTAPASIRWRVAVSETP